MKGFIIGALIGYGLAIAVSTPEGRKIISSAKTTLGSDPTEKENKVKDNDECA